MPDVYTFKRFQPLPDNSGICEIHIEAMPVVATIGKSKSAPECWQVSLAGWELVGTREEIMEFAGMLHQIALKLPKPQAAA